MSMSNEMVKFYIQSKLATAVSQGILRGRTESTDGHSHLYEVMFDDYGKKFIGATSEDGKGPHCHYIMASMHDVTESHLQEDPQPRDEKDLLVYVHEANVPANMRRILNFYNLKEITLTTSLGGYPAEHVHSVTVRFAGSSIDKFGRKTQAAVEPTMDLKPDGELEALKAKHAKAEEILNKTLSDNLKKSV
ncbi:MAG: hypothetical protein MN733_24020 [Nitrososphaera sp.]|nr:hypothetical protein [Nitrososphaera sp.]